MTFRRLPFLRFICGATCLYFPLLPVTAQQTSRFVVRSWQSEDGLPGNVVRAVTQATDGYLWVATAEGTVRFDGVRFTGFDAQPDGKLARLPPRGLFALTNGEVWITTARSGLIRWHDGRLSAIWNDSPDKTPVTQVVLRDNESTLIVRGEEVWLFHRNGKLQIIERSPDVAQILEADLRGAARSGRNTGVTPGLNPLELVDAQGRTWTAAPSGGLTVSDTNGSENVALPTLESGSRINELHEDREGTIWAATGESGLVHIRERRVETLTPRDGLRDRTAGVVLQDSSGTVWIGGGRGGVDRLERDKVTHEEVGDRRNARPLSALCEDHWGTLWAATRDGSVFRREQGVFRPFLNAPNGLTKVRAIVEDKDGRVWFGGSQGLAMWVEETLYRFEGQNGFETTEVTSLACDLAGALWIGTSKGSVWHRNNARFERQKIGRPGGHPIAALLAGRDNSLWVATLGGGLLHGIGGRWTSFGAASGLPDLRLTCLLEDEVGYLWLGSLSGIFRVSKRELAEAERNPSALISWMKISRSDGLISSECSGGGQPSGWRGNDGRLWIPMLRGLAMIHPDKLRINSIPPPVVIEGGKANETSFPGGEKVEAGPGRVRLGFRYTALSLAAPEKLEFRLRLEGLETEWREGTPERMTLYEAVPPGHYRFHVQAANGDGVWNLQGAVMEIHVLPHFWETNSFRALSLCAVTATALAIGWGIARQRLKRRLARLELLNAREAERARIARDLHDDLGASLTEISMLANLAVEDEGPSGPVRQPLLQIASKAHSLVGALDEIVWAVNPRQDTVASLVDYLAAFAGEFLGLAGVTLRLDVPRELPDAPLDSEKRHALFLAARETLNNAARHASCTEVGFQVRLTPRALEIQIKDNGRGFDLGSSARSEGEGIRNVRERLTQLGGQCRIESTPGAGTTVYLALPLFANSSP